MDTASFTLHLAEKMADPENGSPFTKPLRLRDFCGDSWTRTNDPIDVNDVLYRLSHATVYINYDGYATYSMTFKSKAKVGLMTAGWTSCFHDGMPLEFFC